MATGLMAGKRGLIMGLANNRSIAWGIAKQLHAQGAEMAFSYQGEALKRRVEPLAAEVGSDFLVECDVSDEAAMDETFRQIKEKWGELTDDDLDQAAGQRDQLVGRIQERYGLAKDEVNRQLDALIATEPRRAGAGS